MFRVEGSFGSAFRFTAVLMAFAFGFVGIATATEDCDCDCPDGEGPTQATATWNYSSYSTPAGSSCEGESISRELNTTDNVCWPSCLAISTGFLSPLKLTAPKILKQP